MNKLEKNRYSIFTDDLEHCIICGLPKILMRYLWVEIEKIV